MRKYILASFVFFQLCQVIAQQKISIVQEGKLWGVIDQDGKVVVEPSYSHMKPVVNWISVVREGGLWGAVNVKTGVEIVKPQFRKMLDFSEEGIGIAILGEEYCRNNDISASNEDKFIYIDAEGKQIGTKLYDKLYPFNDGVGIAAEGKRKYYVNSDLEEIIITLNGEIVQLSVNPFSEGLGIIVHKKKAGLVDVNGKVVLVPTYQKINSFRDGQATVKDKDLWGLIDKTGRPIVEPIYERISDLAKGYRIITLKGKKGVMDSTGKVVILPEYGFLQSTQSGKWFVVKKKEGHGIIDLTGNFKPMPEDSKDYLKYINGYIIAFGRKGRGLIDDNGQWVALPIYDGFEPMHDDMARAIIDKEERWFYISKTGKEVKIEGAKSKNDYGVFREGLGPVYNGTKMGFVDSEGNWVIEPQFEKQPFNKGKAQFVDGKALVKQNKRYGVIDTKGNWLVDAKYNKMTPYFTIPDTPEEIAARTTLKGYFKFEELSPDNFADIKLYIINDEGDTIAKANTDTNGYFMFTDLPADQNYLVIAESEEDFEMVVVSPLTDKKRAIISRYQGVFMFTFLGGEEPIAMLLMNEGDDVELNGFFRYQILVADNVGAMKVYLVDDEGNIVMTATTDSKGYFSFKNLDPDKNYLVKIDDTDKAVELVMVNEEMKEVAVISPNDGVFKFYYLPSEHEAFLALMVEDDINIMQGFFSYKTLAADRVGGMNVYLINDAGSIVMTAVTDEKGFFKFKNLNPDINYFVKIDAADQDMQLVILGDDAETFVAVMSPDKGGMFLYHELDAEQIAGLGLLYTTDGELVEGLLTKTFRGQFRFKYLAADSLGGLAVHLVDDEGNIVFTTTTDANGMFSFKTLPFDENYIVKLDEVNSDIGLLVIGDGGVSAELATNNKGEFVFMKLPKIAISSLIEMDARSDIALHSSKSSVMAQFKYALLENNFLAKIAVKVLDKDGKIVGAGTTDSKGRVYFNHFSPGDDVTFHFINLSPDQNNIVLTLFNSDSEMIIKVVSDNGSFNYTFLKGDIPFDPLFMSEEDMEMDSAGKGEVIVKKLTDEVMVIYFGFDSDKYNFAENESLIELVEVLRSDESLHIDISAYSDKSGTTEYNQELSNRRSISVVEFLTSNGIRRNRLTTRGLGATNFAVECETCTDMQNQLNRRAVLRIN
ncbi:MAG: OmpA family protein [Flavobacteriales bacterium]|jgi:flagellar motor protein MotB|nr:OmpA family protein [Flavobacteriales bacterium]